MKYFITIVFCFLTFHSFAQHCERPKVVFISLDSVDRELIFNGFNDLKSRIYLRDSIDVFVRMGELIEIPNVEYDSLVFWSLKKLRSKEREIRKCETEKADGYVYVDFNINSIFKKIFMVIKEGETCYKFQMHWVDGME